MCTDLPSFRLRRNAPKCITAKSDDALEFRDGGSLRLVLRLVTVVIDGGQRRDAFEQRFFRFANVIQEVPDLLFAALELTLKPLNLCLEQPAAVVFLMRDEEPEVARVVASPNRET